MLSCIMFESRSWSATFQIWRATQFVFGDISSSIFLASFIYLYETVPFPELILTAPFQAVILDAAMIPA